MRHAVRRCAGVPFAHIVHIGAGLTEGEVVEVELGGVAVLRLATVTDFRSGIAFVNTSSGTLDWSGFAVRSKVNDSPSFQSRPVTVFAS